MLLVTFWTRTGYRHQSRAIVQAEKVLTEYKHVTTYRLTNGKRITIKHENLISVEQST